MTDALLLALAFLAGWFARDAHHYHTVRAVLMRTIAGMKASGRDSITVKIEL